MPSIIAEGRADFCLKNRLLTSFKRSLQQDKALLGCRVFPELGLFAVSWLLGGNNVDFVPDSLALTLSFAGTALALVTAWIGGELVYRLGVGWIQE